MSVLVAKQAPDFKAQAVMPNGGFQEVSLSDYRGKYVLLFFYPLDFTFVCPTEIIAFSEAVAEFEKLGVQVLGCSVDSHYTHLAWRNTPRKEGGIGEIAYPLISITGKVLDRRGNGVRDVLVRVGAFEWHHDLRTGRQGGFRMDGLSQAITWTVSLPDYGVSVEVPITGGGQMGLVEFVERRCP